MIRRIGFAGLGRMGQRMATRLVEAGYELRTYDAVPGRAAGVAGATPVSSPVHLRECDAVLLSVTDGPAVLAVIQALIYSGHAERRAKHPQSDDRTAPAEVGALRSTLRVTLVVDLSTIGVEDSRRVAALCEPAGVGYVRAPLLGTLDAAASGQLKALVSGSPEAVEAARPILERLCAEQPYLGPAEEGRVMKLLVNGLMGITQAALSEALMIGQKAGLEWRQLADVIGSSSSASPIVKGTLARLADRQFEPRLTVSLLAKDLRLLNELAQAESAPAPVASSALQLYEAAANLGWEGYDTSAIFLLLEALNGKGDDHGSKS
ncbi:MAG TPA: NAD(P)-dependent oxidoreductase [Chloroflexota bacterium]|nr:NAD(P)-dependent oxidoreductase [Chloroflexota bacterium]